MAVASLAFGAAVLEVVTTALEKVPDHALSKFILKQWSISGSNQKCDTQVAKLFGAVAGTLNALFYLKNAYQEYYEGDEWLSGA